MVKRIVLSLVSACCISSTGVAQPAKQADYSPQTISLQTRDGLQLAGRFFPGRNGQDTIPVIILHAQNERASTYESLASQLQSEEMGGHAVFIPDLRGHGESVLIEDTQRNRTRKLVAEKLGKNDYLAMVEYDIDSVKKFLLEKHNAGELNIDMLCVVGSEMGSVLAMYWVAQDWSWPPLRGIRQGQDAKAIVLISPPQNLKGLNIRMALESEGVQRDVSIMVLYGGADRRAASHAKRIHGSLQTYRRQKWSSDEERQREQDLFLVPLDTTLQGSKLLGAKSLRVANKIQQFIEFRLRKRADEFPWQERKLPTVGN